MARGSGPLGRPRPNAAAMPKRGKRLKFRAHDACSGRGGRGAGRCQAGVAAGKGRTPRGERSPARCGRGRGRACGERAAWGEDAGEEAAL